MFASETNEQRSAPREGSPSAAVAAEAVTKGEVAPKEERQESAPQPKRESGNDHLHTEPIHPNFLNLDNSSPASQPSHHHHMPHRVEPYPAMNMSMHRRHYDPARHRPSPPPIAALSNSPSLSVSSLDRSAVSTPAPATGQARRSPPQHHAQMHPHHQQQHHQPQSASAGYPGGGPAGYNSRPPPPGLPNHAPYGPGPNGGPPAGPPYPHDPYDGRYAPHPGHPGYGPPPGAMHHHPGPPPPMSHGMAGPDMGQYGPSASYPVPGQMGAPIQYTDEASTKLSDRVRRRCFNCCTTDTSTWRRSNLNHGKVLCNKCGLFERTHSRPRPEQFPHKRGPLASSNLPSAPRSPPDQQHMQPGTPGQALPPPPPPPPGHHHHPQQSPQHQQHPHHPPHPAGPGAPGGYMPFPPVPYQPGHPGHQGGPPPPPPTMEGGPGNGNSRPRGSASVPSSPGPQYISTPSLPLPSMNHGHWQEAPRTSSPTTGPGQPPRPEDTLMRRDSASSSSGPMAAPPTTNGTGSVGGTAPGTPSMSVKSLATGPGVPGAAAGGAERRDSGAATPDSARMSTNGRSVPPSRQGTPRMSEAKLAEA